MGWFSNIFNKVKKIGRNGINALSNAGHFVKNRITSTYNAAKKIPIIGKVIKDAVNTHIPMLGGKSLKDIGGMASRGLDVVDDVKDGNYRKALDEGRQLYRDVRESM